MEEGKLCPRRRKEEDNGLCLTAAAPPPQGGSCVSGGRGLRERNVSFGED